MGGYDKGQTAEFMMPCSLVLTLTFCKNMRRFLQSQTPSSNIHSNENLKTDIGKLVLWSMKIID
jgi:hypothetical protein